MSSTVRDIIAQYLRDNNYDGLCGGDCGCGLNDLMPCFDRIDDCCPGYRWECAECPPAFKDSCEYSEGEGGCWRSTKQDDSK